MLIGEPVALHLHYNWEVFSTPCVYFNHQVIAIFSPSPSYHRYIVYQLLALHRGIVMSS